MEKSRLMSHSFQSCHFIITMLTICEFILSVPSTFQVHVRKRKPEPCLSITKSSLELTPLLSKQQIIYKNTSKITFEQKTVLLKPTMAPCYHDVRLVLANVTHLGIKCWSLSLYFHGVPAVFSSTCDVQKVQKRIKCETN